MTILAYAYIIFSVAKTIIAVGSMVESSRRGINYEVTVSFGTVIALIFSGRIIGWW